MSPMNLADFNQRITFQALAASEDSLGQPSGAWVDVATDPTVWAKSAFISGRDLAAAGQLQATLDAKFIVRYRADVLPSWRVLWRGQPLDIVGEPADIDGAREWLSVACTKGVRDGR